MSKDIDDTIQTLIALKYGLPKDAVVLELLDFFEVVALGAKKYAMNNWLDKAGVKCDHKSMHDSMFRHLAASSMGIRSDYESHKDPLLHLACRSMMLYTRYTKNLEANNEENLQSVLKK